MDSVNNSVPIVFLPGRLIHAVLPTAAVEEIIVSKAFEPSSQSASLIIGKILWRDSEVPVIALDKHTEQGKNMEIKGEIITIVKLPKSGDLVGIATVNTPQHIVANDRNLVPNNSPHYLIPHTLHYVSINGKPAIIPNLQQLEEELLH